MHAFPVSAKQYSVIVCVVDLNKCGLQKQHKSLHVQVVKLLLLKNIYISRASCQYFTAVRSKANTKIGPFPLVTTSRKKES